MNKYVRAIALDPGITTGYAEGTIRDGKMIVTTGQDKWNHMELWNRFLDFVPDFIISERFVYRQSRYNKKEQTGIELFSRELIGVANLFCQMYEREFKLQNVMKDNDTTYFNNARLKTDLLYKPGREHANDAARHLLYWFKFGQGFQFNKAGYISGS